MFPNTVRFSEDAQFLGGIPPASYTTDQEIAWMNLANFHRAVVLTYTGALSDGMYIDLHEGSDAAGTGEDEFDDSDDDLTLTAADDNTMNIQEVRCEEFSAGCSWLKVYAGLDVAGPCFYTIEVWGLSPRFAAVSTAALEHVEDH